MKFAACLRLSVVALSVLCVLGACASERDAARQMQESLSRAGGGPATDSRVTPLRSAQATAQQNFNTTLQEDEVMQAQAARAIKAMVTVTTRVKRLLPADNKGRRHQKFLLGLSDGSTVLVAHSTDSAPEVPIQAGDIVTIHGEYIWNAKGGLIHWTHHSDSPRHEGGWIDFNGQRYQ